MKNVQPVWYFKPNITLRNSSLICWVASSRRKTKAIQVLLVPTSNHRSLLCLTYLRFQNEHSHQVCDAGDTSGGERAAAAVQLGKSSLSTGKPNNLPTDLLDVFQCFSHFSSSLLRNSFCLKYFSLLKNAQANTKKKNITEPMGPLGTSKPLLRSSELRLTRPQRSSKNHPMRVPKTIQNHQKHTKKTSTIKKRWVSSQ